MLDGVLFFTQVIVTRELNGKNHGWLKSLSDKLKKGEMEAIHGSSDSVRLSQSPG